jgi:hypothetical protein
VSWSTADGRLRWRSTVALARPLAVLTHRGWIGPSGPEAPGPGPWREAAAVADLGAGAPGGETICLVVGSRLEAWDAAGGTAPRFAVDAPGVTRLVAGPGTCHALAGRRLLRASAAGLTVLAEDAGGFAPAQGGLVVWNDTRAAVLDAATGVERAAFAVDRRVSAMLARDGGAYLVGFSDGFVVEGRPEGGVFRPTLTFADTPAAAVRALAAGPAESAVVGFGDGAAGVWSARTGRRLLAQRLAGPVDHLLVGGSEVLVATATGDVASLDLSALGRDYCAVLQEIWETTPVVWSDTGAVLRPVPADHPCARRGR